MTGARHRPGAVERGYALVWALLALTALTVLAAAAAPLVVRAREQAVARATQRRLDAIERALQRFYRDHRRFPSATEGLEALLVDPGSGRWRGPYLAETDAARALSDPYGRRFAYTVSDAVATVTPPRAPEQSRSVTPALVVRRWVVRAREELEAIAAAARAYADQYDGLPDAIGDLVPSRLGADYALDPWGRPYAIDPAAGRASSAGPDGLAGTSDDITVDLGRTGAATGGAIPEPPPFVPTDPSGWQAAYESHMTSYRDQLAAAQAISPRSGEDWERRFTRFGLAYYHLLRANGIRAANR